VGSRRVATVFERDVGRPVIVHHRSLLTDGLLMDAISSKPGSQLRMLGQRGDASPTGPTSLLRDTACWQRTTSSGADSRNDCTQRGR
jgi:hypothetical protein